MSQRTPFGMSKWVPFGTHADDGVCSYGGRLEFGPNGEDGLPDYERHPGSCRAADNRGEYVVSGAALYALIRRQVITTRPTAKCCGIERDADGFCQHRPGHPVFVSVRPYRDPSDCATLDESPQSAGTATGWPEA